MTEMMAMPVNYAAIDEEEMTYLDGGSKFYVGSGASLDQRVNFLSKNFTSGYAAALKEFCKLGGISSYDLNAEIFAHAVLYYEPISWVASLLGLSYAKSLKNSCKTIEVENHVDNRKLGGILPYYVAFRTIYSALPSLY